LVGVVPRTGPFSTGQIVQAVLQQAGSPDEREQAQIGHFVQEFAQSYHRSHQQLWTTLDATLTLWRDSPNFQFAACCVLSISATLLKDLSPFGKMSLRFLEDTLLPLATSAHFFYFRRQYSEMVMALMRFDPKRSVAVLGVLLRSWPHMHTGKQIAFLKLFSATLPCVPHQQLPALLPRALAIVRDCMVQSAQKVADTALNFLMDSGLSCFFTENARVVLTTLYDAMAKASKSHWSTEVRDLARTALATVAKFDTRMYREIAKASEQKPASDDVKLQVWTSIAQTATRKDSGLKLGTRLAEIMKVFGNRGVMNNEVIHARRGSIAVPARGALPLLRRVTAPSPGPPPRPLA
jgi:hypothetical protein